MQRLNNKFTKLDRDIRGLKCGETLAHFIDEELRMAAYGLQKPLAVDLKIREVPTKPGKFEVTRIK